MTACVAVGVNAEKIADDMGPEVGYEDDRGKMPQRVSEIDDTVLSVPWQFVSDSIVAVLALIKRKILVRCMLRVTISCSRPCCCNLCENSFAPF